MTLQPTLQMTLIYVHLATVLPAAVLGAWLLLRPKGSPMHRLLGKAYMSLMLVTALITLFIEAQVGPQFLSHFGAIHLLSVLVIYSVPRAYFAAKAGDHRTHRSNMLGVYLGGILIAGAFTLVPGRYLNGMLFGG
jgi:uncharacterized membrane protein